MSDDPLTRFTAFCKVQDLDERRRIVESIPNGDPNKPLFLISLATKLRLGMVDIRDIDQAITSCRLAVELSKNVPPLFRLALRELGRSTVARFERFGALADLEEAIASHRRVLELTPDDDPELLQHVREYAERFVSLVKVRDDIDTLREACTWSRCAVELVTDAHEAKPGLLYVLGRLLTACVLHRGSGTVDDLHEAIIVLVRAVELTPGSNAAMFAYMFALQIALLFRFHQDLEDVASLAQYRSAVDILPKEVGHQFLTLLARSFRAKFIHNLGRDDYEQAIIDLDTAIELQRRVLEQPAHDQDGLPRMDRTAYLSPTGVDTSAIDLPVVPRSDSVDFLASLLLFRLECPYYVSTFSRHSATVDLIPEEHPKKPSLLTALAEAFRTRFEAERDTNDFVEAVTAARHALRLQPDSIGALRCLGCALVGRFIFDKSLASATDDLDEAIPLLERAGDILLDSNEFDEHVMLALTEALSMRFERLGETAVSDLQRAIALLQHAIDHLRDGHADIPIYLAQLANMLRARFIGYRRTRDVEDAIQAMKRALDLLPSSERRSRCLVKLGMLFTDRFEHLRHNEDMDNTVEAFQEAASGSHFQPDLLPRLAFALLRRSTHAGGPESAFDEAVDLLEGAIARAPLDPSMQQYLALLGHALALRFQHRGVLDDLDKAVDVSERSLSLAAGSSDKDKDGLTLISLAICYKSRFGISHDPADLDKGIAFLRDMVDYYPSWSLGTDALMSLVGDLILRLQTNPSPQIDHLREARDQTWRAFSAGGGPRDTLEAALQFVNLVGWAGLLPKDETESLLEDVTDMYGRIMLLIPQVAWLGDGIERRLARLSGYSTRNIVGAAVAHALRMNDPTRALEWFEQGRAIVWTQINGLRTPVEELRTKFPNLAVRLELTAQALEDAGRKDVSFHGRHERGTSGSRTVQVISHADDDLRAALVEVGSAVFAGDEHISRTSYQDKVDEHRRLAEDYRELLEEIRGLAGFENFLRPRSIAELSFAAVHGPVACINMHSSRCDALILCGSDLHHVPLPNLSPEVADELQQTMYNFLGLEFPRDRKSRPAHTTANDSLLGVLRQIWVVVVQPVFAVLGWTDDGLVYERRIKWCTRGSLAFLPLHAAGPYTGTSLNASDIAVSSYTSTLAALLPEPSRSGSTAPAQSSILMVAQRDAPGGSCLPGTEQEFEHVLEHFSGTSSTFLLGPQGTAAAVLENMSEHPYIHLACHGIQGMDNPMTSAFLLADRRLTLYELMAKAPHAGELAFLSACETSKGHEKIPDEVVHLAAAMLGVGYRSVVGTMWSISDSAAPLVADEFYNIFLQLPAVNGRPDVAYALHVATQVLREKVGDDAVAMWVPFVHFGL